MVGNRDSNPIFSYGSYGKNEWCTDGEWWDPAGAASLTYYFRNIRVKSVSRIPLHGDANWAAGFPLWSDEPADVERHNPVCGCGGEINRWNLNRHNYSVNFVFLDWSVRKVGLRQLWAVKWNTESEGPTNAPVSPWGNINYVPNWEDLEDPAWPEWMKKSKNYDL